MASWSFLEACWQQVEGSWGYFGISRLSSGSRRGVVGMSSGCPRGFFGLSSRCSRYVAFVSQVQRNVVREILFFCLRCVVFGVVFRELCFEFCCFCFWETCFELCYVDVECPDVERRNYKTWKLTGSSTRIHIYIIIDCLPRKVLEYPEAHQLVHNDRGRNLD